MSRRRSRDPVTPKRPYESVFSCIDAMEKDIVAHTVKPKFEPMDVVRMLITDEQIAFLRRTSDIVDLGWLGPRAYSAEHEVYDNPVHFHIRCEHFGIAVWKPEIARFDAAAPRVSEFLDTLRQLMVIHEQWQRVRTVARYFNQNDVSLGAVRYYWPSMGVFLPPGHPFHALRGSTGFREPGGVAPYLDLFRATAGIVSAAKFLPAGIKHKTVVQLGFEGSNRFGIL